MLESLLASWLKKTQREVGESRSRKSSYLPICLQSFAKARLIGGTQNLEHVAYEGTV